jgi:virginiamycin B lyase
MLRSLSLLVAMATLAAPAAAAEMTYYDVPAGSHPHDVAPAPDGTVWYTGQWTGVLGRLDPKTGQVEHIPLGTNSAPHGVIVGPDGAAWVTDGGQNAIVRVDPASKAVKVFPLPKDFADANLNTATFDGRQVLWFTGQNGVYGRFDPGSGQVAAWKAPKGAGPYGIATTPSGEVWYASLAGDHIARIDAASGRVSVVEPPKPRVGPRRIWADSKGLLWVSFWNSGEVGRYDPVAKSWKTWALPNSTRDCYSVYVDDKDRVWLTDFAKNAILRFDPASETFASFPSSKPRAMVRQMLGRAGEVWGAESGNDRLVVVRD